MTDKVIALPLPNARSRPGRMLEAAAERPGESRLGAVFLFDNGRVSVWAADEIETQQEWDWFERRLQVALDNCRKMRAEHRPAPNRSAD